MPLRVSGGRWQESGAAIGVWRRCKRKYDLLMRRRETPELSEEEQQNGILPVRLHPVSIHFIFVYSTLATIHPPADTPSYAGLRQDLIIIQL